MNVVVDQSKLPSTRAKLRFVDCDIHPSMRSPADLKPFLEKRWWDHLTRYGSHAREMYSDTIGYPRMTPAIARNDAWPPGGAPPGADLDFMRRQHLDHYDVEAGILMPLSTRGPEQRNLDFGAAMCTALNDWQKATWLDPEPRLHGTILLPHEDAQAAVREIERRAGDRRFVGVQLSPRASEPIGRRRYWPIFEAAQAADLPISMHQGGIGGHAVTGSGWVSYYFEEHHTNVQTLQSVVASIVLEGVFERFPDLRWVIIEPGFAWVPPLAWRLDKLFERMRDEVPHLKMKPSEYIRRNIWFTTQPIDEPERPGDLEKVIEWIGHDRLMFSTDYPHWDFDDPSHALNLKIPEAQRQRILRGNAIDFYKLAI
jgi:predicted TIM-barrel fold metal-dependent hydrolase